MRPVDGDRTAGGPAASPGRGEAWALGALGALVVITVAWWALALWPVPGGNPAWLERARLVCFGATESGLPDASGWLLLVGQPLGMLGLLLAGWGRTVRSALAGLTGTAAGRIVVASTGLALLVGVGAAGVRVADASERAAFRPPPAGDMPSPDYPRLDREAPGNRLVDQHGKRVGLADLRGQSVLVTFAFGHCTTLCPVVVQRAKTARELSAEAGVAAPALVVVTLDPWRDTPDRLAHLAHHWELPDDALVLGGEVREVEDALDAWGVARERDRLTGDITHPPLVYVVDGEGTIAYASTGGAEAIAELVRRTQAP